jgi:hypothetical protein
VLDPCHPPSFRHFSDLKIKAVRGPRYWIAVHSNQYLTASLFRSLAPRSAQCFTAGLHILRAINRLAKDILRIALYHRLSIANFYRQIRYGKAFTKRIVGDMVSVLEAFLVATLKCSDCGKPDVQLTDFFLMPDKVWDAMCPLDAILYLGCFGKRLNPADPPDKERLAEEIYRQRKRFKLKNVNRWLGEKKNGEVYRGHYLVLFHAEPKAEGKAAGLDEEMLKKVMTSKRVHERNAAASRHPALGPTTASKSRSRLIPLRNS